MLPTDLDNAQRIVELIRDLTQDEGDMVSIHNDNPDPGGPNCGIIIYHRYKRLAHFYGDSVLECLEKAKRERDGRK